MSVARVAVLLLLPIVCRAVEAKIPVFIRFDEALVGFGVEGGSDNDTLNDFKWAYERGKEANSSLGFSLRVIVPDIQKFVADEMRPGVCIGNATADVLTGPGGTAVGTGGKINIFDHGVLPAHELRMEYTLPFQAANGSNYTLIGVKHIPGNDCLNILYHMTTLYVHVRDMDTPAPHQIVRKGMVKISAVGVLKLIASLRLGGGNWPLKPVQELEGLVSFVAVLGKDVIQDCLNKSAFSNNFHYFWSSDGDVGFLLDLVRRPTNLELRLASFKRGSPPTVTRQIIDGTIDYHEDGTSVTLGPLTLSDSRCNGTVAGIPIDIGFDEISSPTNRTMVFLPEAFREGPEKVISEIVPLVTSQYGKVTSDPLRKRSVGSATLKPGAPLVKTTYQIPFGLSVLRWAMLSAAQFAGTDLQVEIVATPITVIETLGYIAEAYVLFEGKEYHLNTVIDLVGAVKVTHAGDFDAGQTHRLFEATVHIKPNLLTSTKIALSCSAPSEAFALLEKEGNTYIHTSLLGDCSATVTSVLKANFYTSTGVNLIEVKGTAPAAASMFAEDASQYIV